MRRREFLLIGGAMAATPAQLMAQARGSKIGFLHPGQASLLETRINAIREGVFGPDNQYKDLQLVVRSSDGNHARRVALANELAAIGVDVIIAAARPAVLAARGATRTIPVVAIDLETDPVASGWIASLARPADHRGRVFARKRFSNALRRIVFGPGSMPSSAKS